MAELTHFDAKGDAHMVDVGAKAQTKRIARARGEIHMAPATFCAFAQQERLKKAMSLGLRALRPSWPQSVHLS